MKSKKAVVILALIQWSSQYRSLGSKEKDITRHTLEITPQGVSIAKDKQKPKLVKSSLDEEAMRYKKEEEAKMENIRAEEKRIAQSQNRQKREEEVISEASKKKGRESLHIYKAPTGIFDSFSYIVWLLVGIFKELIKSLYEFRTIAIFEARWGSSFFMFIGIVSILLGSLVPFLKNDIFQTFNEIMIVFKGVFSFERREIHTTDEEEKRERFIRNVESGEVIDTGDPYGIGGRFNERQEREKKYVPMWRLLVEKILLIAVLGLFLVISALIVAQILGLLSLNVLAFLRSIGFDTLVTFLPDAQAQNQLGMVARLFKSRIFLSGVSFTYIFLEGVIGYFNCRSMSEEEKRRTIIRTNRASIMKIVMQIVSFIPIMLVPEAYMMGAVILPELLKQMLFPMLGGIHRYFYGKERSQELARKYTEYNEETYQNQKSVQNMIYVVTFFMVVIMGSVLTINYMSIANLLSPEMKAKLGQLII